jgi:NADPH2:quinone reductase
VYDGVGKPTFLAGLDALRKRGTMVVFGNAGGAHPDPLPVTTLTQKGSVQLARPALYDYLLTQRELEQRANELFSYLRDGSLLMPIASVLPLRDAEAAHRALEAGEVVGKWLFELP